MAEIKWPGWKTVRKIGSGGFGAVYEIQRQLPDGTMESAALKVISIPQSDSEIEELYSSGANEMSVTSHFLDCRSRIVGEYSTMLKLKGHPNVVYCDDIRHVQQDNGIGWDIFIRMELLTPLLKSLQPANPKNDAQTAIQLGRDIASALAACESMGICHRDIKPQNIFLSGMGSYKLGDFGIAKVVEKTTNQTKAGSYPYMAPEVYHNRPYGMQADIYSLGMTMYWMLNNRQLPFLKAARGVPSPEEREEALKRRMNGEPLPAPVNGSQGLKKVVLKACAFEPKNRYKTAKDLLADLDRVAAGLPPEDQDGDETVKEDGISGDENGGGSGWPMKALIAAVIGLCIVVGGLIGYLMGDREDKPSPEETQMVDVTQPEVTAEPVQMVEEPQQVAEEPQQTAVLEEVSLSEETEPIQTEPPAVQPPVQMPSWVMRKPEDLEETELDMSEWSEQGFWGQNRFARKDVREVRFYSTMENVPASNWDVSQNGDGTVLAWMDGGVLSVAAEGRAAPNPNAVDMFAAFENMERISFADAFDTSGVQNMYGMFWGCTSLESLDLSNFDTASANCMGLMFARCSALSELDLSAFRTDNVTDMSYMFYCCSGLRTLDLRTFNTSQVRDMKRMFYQCRKLESVNVSGFDTGNVRDFSYMFQQCTSLESVDVSGFRTPEMTHLNYMFDGCSSLNAIDIRQFDFSNVLGMTNVFAGCTGIRELQADEWRVSSKASYQNFMMNGGTINGQPWESYIRSAQK